MLTLDRYHRPHHPARRRGVRAAGRRALDGARCSSTTRGSATSTWTRAPTSTWRWRSRSTPRRSGSSVCNALETLLVHAAVAPRASCPRLAARLARGRRRAARLTSGRGPSCPARGRPSRRRLGHGVPRLHPRGPGGRRASTTAIAHIRRHGSGLAEAIVTRDLRRARRFTREVDAAAVLVNASTRLVDGSQFGMGAEMGISTSRVHARGPGRGARADHDQVRRAGRRAGAGVAACCRASASSADRSTRSTSATCSLADEICEALGLDRVLFVPAARAAPQAGGRAGARRASLPDDRARRPRAPALRGLRRRASRARGPSYTVDTLASAAGARATCYLRHRIRDVPRSAELARAAARRRAWRAWSCPAHRQRLRSRGAGRPRRCCTSSACPASCRGAERRTAPRRSCCTRRPCRSRARTCAAARARAGASPTACPSRWSPTSASSGSTARSA